MSWHYDKSLERIEKHRDGIGDIEVIKLVREADLNQLLSETTCREIYGAHVYVTVSNFVKLASDTIYAEDDYKRLIQGVHIYQREVARIVEDGGIFDGLRVHFQGPKLHALFYRPIDAAQELATRAVLLQLVLKDFVKSVFNPAFPTYDNFAIAAGADIGSVIGTRNGRKSDRELLFLGAPANYAAKIISSSGQLRLTKSIFDALPENLRELCEDKGEDVYQVSAISQSDLDNLLEEYEIAWDRKKSEDRIKDDKAGFPLKDITYSSANTLIDLDSLSINNNKRVLAASVFGDLSGFTSYIDAAETEDEKKKALKVLHVVRKEMATVLTDDFNGLRVQFQGDRVQGLFHMPKDEEGSIATEAVEAAIALQSSMEHTIKAAMPDAKDLSLAVGVDIDTTLASKLGTRAHRDRICLGESVEQAAINEELCTGGQIGISSRVYQALPESLSKHFAYDEDAKCYTANSLTADKVERAAKAASAVAGVPAFIRSTESGVTVSMRESKGARLVTPARSYSNREN